MMAEQTTESPETSSYPRTEAQWVLHAVEQAQDQNRRYYDKQFELIESRLKQLLEKVESTNDLVNQVKGGLSTLRITLAVAGLLLTAAFFAFRVWGLTISVGGG